MAQNGQGNHDLESQHRDPIPQVLRSDEQGVPTDKSDLKARAVPRD